MKQLQNKKGFSLIFAMGLVLSITITILYLLEYIMPFAKHTKGIEFSSNAFYQSTSAIEDGLYYVATHNLGDEPSSIVNVGDTNNTKFTYDVVARGDTIPPTGEGNSEYAPDRNWNMLAIGEPLQLEIGENNWSDASISLRVPNTGFGEGISVQSMTGGIITWQLSSQNGTLSSGTGSSIGREMLKSGVEKNFNFTNKYNDGKTLTDEDISFPIYYNNCNQSGEKCTLKLSVINNLILDDMENTPVPYIEYKIEGADDIPLRYTRIQTSGYSNGFKKDLYIKIPQQTVNEAFDFTVFQ